MSETVAEAELEQLYATLPRLACQRKCAASCGPIYLSRYEWQRITGRSGDGVQSVVGTVGMACPWLAPSGLCSVYERRPLICRLWGAVEALRCPWGCVPERWVSNDEFRELWRAVLAVDA